MWRMIVFAVSGILQVVVLILMIIEARKARKMRKTAEFLIDELKRKNKE